MLEILIIIVSFLTTIIIMPHFIRRMHKQGFVGKDMNKFNQPKIAELGGVVTFLGFSFGLLFAIFLSTYLSAFNIELSILLAGFCTIALIVFVGFIDDIIGWKKGIRQWQHALFPIIAALPLMAIAVGQTTMNLPLIGTVDFGIFYALIIIPIGVTGASNAFNMLAGFNGLEAGQGIILTSTLTIIAFLTGQTTAMILGIAMIGALIGFLLFNWFPAKIFGGDSLTLMIGANLAVMSIIGNMETIGVIIMVLFFVEFLIKAKYKFQSECFGIPQKNGILFPQKEKGSITQYILSIKPMKEQNVTIIILLTQTLICIIVFIIFFGGRI